MSVSAEPADKAHAGGDPAGLAELDVEARLVRLRWPHGVVCPFCAHDEHYRLDGEYRRKDGARRSYWKCKACHKKFAIFTGTALQGSNLSPSRLVEVATYICSAKGRVSLQDVRRTFALSYASARRLCRLLSAHLTNGRAGAQGANIKLGCLNDEIFSAPDHASTDSALRVLLVGGGRAGPLPHDHAED